MCIIVGLADTSRICLILHIDKINLVNSKLMIITFNFLNN